MPSVAKKLVIVQNNDAPAASRPPRRDGKRAPEELRLLEALLFAAGAAARRGDAGAPAARRRRREATRWPRSRPNTPRAASIWCASARNGCSAPPTICPGCSPRRRWRRASFRARRSRRSPSSPITSRSRAPRSRKSAAWWRPPARSTCCCAPAGSARAGGARRRGGRSPTAPREQFLTHFGLEEVGDLPGLDELKGAGLLEGNLPPGFAVPMPSDDTHAARRRGPARSRRSRSRAGAAALAQRRNVTIRASAKRG